MVVAHQEITTTNVMVPNPDYEAAVEATRPPERDIKDEK
jgi:hypothetical protein